jgi:hypothetical protein
MGRHHLIESESEFQRFLVIELDVRIALETALSVGGQSHALELQTKSASHTHTHTHTQAKRGTHESCKHDDRPKSACNCLPYRCAFEELREQLLSDLKVEVADVRFERRFVGNRQFDARRALGALLLLTATALRPLRAFAAVRTETVTATVTRALVRLRAAPALELGRRRRGSGGGGGGGGLRLSRLHVVGKQEPRTTHRMSAAAERRVVEGGEKRHLRRNHRLVLSLLVSPRLLDSTFHVVAQTQFGCRMQNQRDVSNGQQRTQKPSARELPSDVFAAAADIANKRARRGDTRVSSQAGA